MEFVIFFIWVFGSLFIAAAFGSTRTIGFAGSLLLSLLLSPIIGLLICLFSPTLEEEKRKLEVYAALVKKNEQENPDQKIDQPQIKQPKIQETQFVGSVADELKKLKEILDAGVLTQEEFDAQKKKLLGQ